MLVRGTKAFIKIAKVGEVNDKGKEVLSVGYSGKLIAQPEAPLASLAVPLMRDLLPHVLYDNREQFDLDVNCLRRFVDALEYVPGKGE